MRRGLVIIITSLFWSTGFAQISDLAKDYKQDFVTPEHPAFMILDEQPSEILRPSNIKEFSTITSEYFKGPAYVLPRSFSMEISPALLLRANNLTVQDYAKKSNWIGYGCRISVATRAVDDSWQKRNLGLGFRMTLFDDGDFRKDSVFLADFAALVKEAHSITKYNSASITTILADDPELMALEKLASDVSLSTEKQIKYNNDYNDLRQRKKALLASTNDSTLYKSVEEKIVTLRKNYVEANWNATRVDWGIATKLITPDTIVSKNLQYNKTSFWVTGALRLNKKTRKVQHQLLTGLNFNHEHRGLQTLDSLMTNPDSSVSSVTYVYNPDSSMFNKIGYTLSLRYYLGTNRVKGFVEAQLKGESFFQEKSLDLENNIFQKSTQHVVDFTFKAGMEVNVSDGIWVNANVGYSAKKNTTLGINSSDFIYGFDLRFNLPEKFKLF